MRAIHLLPLGAALIAGAPSHADVCGCAGSPATLGAFDSADPDTWPTVDGRPTTITGNAITLPLSADGVLVFDSFTLSNAPGGANATLVFAPNASNTPVRLLVAGDVVVGAGDVLDVRGGPGESGSTTAGAGRGGLGGPGGFKGGDAATPFYNFQTIGGNGFGPGGGAPGDPATNGGVRDAGSPGLYVGPSDLLPLLGGSGGGGASTTNATSSGVSGGGGGGGGALLVAANGTITVDGTIDASGGRGGSLVNGTFGAVGGSGSGGTLRLLADTVRGSGQLLARGGIAPVFGSAAEVGGLGRIRVEAFTNQLATANTDPVMQVAAAPGTLENALSPAIAIVEVGGAAVAQPAIGYSGSLGSVDVIVPAPGLVPVRVESRFVASGTQVALVAKPRFGALAPLAASATLAACQPSGVCTGDASFSLQPGDYSIEARATFEAP